MHANTKMLLIWKGNQILDLYTPKQGEKFELRNIRKVFYFVN